MAAVGATATAMTEQGVAATALGLSRMGSPLHHAVYTRDPNFGTGAGTGAGAI